MTREIFWDFETCLTFIWKMTYLLGHILTPWSCQTSVFGTRKWRFQLQKRVSVPKPHTFMLFLSIVTAYIIKVYDKKPSSFAWVEQNVKSRLSSYMSPESVTDSIDFTIATLILWLCIYLAYRMILRSLLNYKGNLSNLNLNFGYLYLTVFYRLSHFSIILKDSLKKFSAIDSAKSFISGEFFRILPKCTVYM